MAVLTLHKIWINLVTTGEAVAAYSSDRGITVVAPGEVRRYAGGRQRAITSKGQRREFVFKLRDVTDAQWATLELWLGKLVVVRDYRGKKYFGTFFSLAVTERKTLDLNDIAITVTEVTYNEGV